MHNLVIAMREEAEPFINRFALKMVDQQLFNVYENDCIRLIISGYGKIHAAAAVSSLVSMTSHKAVDDIWINVGIAGSAAFPINNWIMARQVVDHSTRRYWRLPVDPACEIRSADVMTVDRVESTYKGGYVYDMEASGFVTFARMVAPAERVMCFKIISDTPKVSAIHHCKQKVFTLMDSGADELIDIIKKFDRKFAS